MNGFLAKGWFTQHDRGNLKVTRGVLVLRGDTHNLAEILDVNPPARRPVEAAHCQEQGVLAGLAEAPARLPVPAIANDDDLAEAPVAQAASE